MTLLSQVPSNQRLELLQYYNRTLKELISHNFIDEQILNAMDQNMNILSTFDFNGSEYDGSRKLKKNIYQLGKMLDNIVNNYHPPITRMILMTQFLDLFIPSIMEITSIDDTLDLFGNLTL